MKKSSIIIPIAAAALCMTGCSTPQKVVTPPPTVKEPAVDTFEIHPVEMPSEVLTIANGLKVLKQPELAPQLLAKQEYKSKKDYKVNRLNDYDIMYYKNCRLPKVLSNGAYEDLPKALKKGISSYVGISSGGVEIGVFNNKAYQSLIDQVTGAGFKLAADGYEQEYSNGVYSVYCYASGRRVRITHTVR